jgi:hypothetical protein
VCVGIFVVRQGRNIACARRDGAISSAHTADWVLALRQVNGRVATGARSPSAAIARV